MSTSQSPHIPGRMSRAQPRVGAGAGVTSRPVSRAPSRWGTREHSPDHTVPRSRVEAPVAAIAAARSLALDRPRASWPPLSRAASRWGAREHRGASRRASREGDREGYAPLSPYGLSRLRRPTGATTQGRASPDNQLPAPLGWRKLPPLSLARTMRPARVLRSTQRKTR